MAKANTDKKTQDAAKGAKKKTADKAKTQAQAATVSPSGLKDKALEFKEFLDESRVEMKKVTWPTRKETVTTSVAVLILVIVMSLFLGVVDLGLSKFVEYVLS